MNDHGFRFCSVSKFYNGAAAVSELSFVVPTGHHTAILGPSGCGKSTILRLLAGLEMPSTGEVLLNGTVISEPNKIVLPPHRRGVAMVFQDLALWPNLSVIQNVLLALSGRGISRREARARAKEALVLCGIESLADRLPGTLSGGQQQRVALARAIAPRPVYLLLDEPFAGLDLVTKMMLLNEISELAEKESFTILLVTHDPLEATVLCRSAVVLNQGRIEESGDLTDLLRAPRSEILKLFRAHLRASASTSGP